LPFLGGGGRHRDLPGRRAHPASLGLALTGTGLAGRRAGDRPRLHSPRWRRPPVSCPSTWPGSPPSTRPAIGSEAGIGRFCAITELRGGHPAEMALLRQAYEHVLGGLKGGGATGGQGRERGRPRGPSRTTPGTSRAPSSQAAMDRLLDWRGRPERRMAGVGVPNRSTEAGPQPTPPVFPRRSPIG
jgi:hypothetical protein